MRTVNSQVEGCSLVGIDVEHCLTPSDNPQFSLDSCCTSLNIVVKAGYYCLCSLLGPSEYSFLNTRLAISFSNCNISIPSITHCQVVEPQPMAMPPPEATVAQPIQMLAPPNLPIGDEFVHLPPKVEESTTISIGNNSSATTTADTNENQSPSLPKLSIPERWGFIQQSNRAHRIIMLSTKLLPVAVFAFAA
ncbi:uncharacterized protein LOC127250185 [Andrographis paniculata]|uniref:uncharacterized protein LOC127250185 n=1 Tax=Andrographis paniculata TaxID=175694 RepID=UPI0021E8DA1D|nr:uncharacterized protein LOC127250185 [Andrographis paniculata]